MILLAKMDKRIKPNILIHKADKIYCVNINKFTYWTCKTQQRVKWCNNNENTPIKHTAIFHARKNDNFHLKIFDYFLIFAKNIDCGYTLEPPHWGGSNEYPQYMF